jgi:hypothetical protein
LLVKKRNLEFLVELIRWLFVRITALITLVHPYNIGGGISILGRNEGDHIVDSERVSETALQDLINDVESVISSKVKLDDKGNAVEIHVLADKSRNAKQIVRDVQSAVIARFGIDVNHRVISIAQLNYDNAAAKEQRLLFKGMEMAIEGVAIDVKVVLSHGERDYIVTPEKVPF